MARRIVEPLRGQVWFVRSQALGDKPFVIISENHRNRALTTVLGIRITTSPRRPSIPTVVPLGTQEPVVGRALCDDISILPKGKLVRHAGALSASAMRDVEEGVLIALGIER